MIVKKFIVREAGREREVIIAMTEDEAKDKSYLNYLEESIAYKTGEELRVLAPKPKPIYTLDHTRGLLREYGDFLRRGERKYF